MTDVPKTCPVCKHKFTRQELGLNENQWFLRIYCCRKCYFKGTKDNRVAKRAG